MAYNENNDRINKIYMNVKRQNIVKEIVKN